MNKAKKSGYLVFVMLINFIISFGQMSVMQNKVMEWSVFTKTNYDNPFYDVSIHALVKCPDGKTITLPAFWKGNGEWGFRFSSPEVGDYSYITECSDNKNTELHSQKGGFRIVPYRGTNRLYSAGAVRAIAGKRFMEHTDGTPFFWLADSWWFGMSKRIAYNDFCMLVNDRKEKGFSVIQFAIGFACDIEPFDQRDSNEAGFIWNKDLSSINPEYFEYTDRRISYLVESGIIPNIVGAWAYYINFTGTDKMKKHWEYIIARYGAFPVTWTVCGEAGLAWYKSENSVKQIEHQRHEWSVVAEHIKLTDPFNRLLTVHSGPNSGNHIPIENMALIDLFLTQPGHNDFETLPVALSHMKKAHEMYPGKPVMAGEVCFEGMAGASKEKIQRYLFWSHLLSGAAGHCYGNDAMWQFNSRDDKFGPSVSGHTWGNEPWEDAYKWPGSLHVGIGKKILEGLKWQEMEPHPEWIIPSATPDNFMRPFAAGSPGNWRIFYFPGKVTPWGVVNRIVKIERDVNYSASWANPLTGELSIIGNVTADGNGEWNVPAAPILHDWVLIFERINK